MKGLLIDTSFMPASRLSKAFLIFLQQPMGLVNLRMKFREVIRKDVNTIRADVKVTYVGISSKSAAKRCSGTSKQRTSQLQEQQSKWRGALKATTILVQR